MNGTCQTKESCTGATLLGICKTTSYICCLNDTDSNINYPENTFLPLSVYRKLVGNSTRATSLYRVFSRALTEARVATCHQAAAFLSMVQGETSNLMLFHELLKDSFKFDFDANLGNNQTGDGARYEGKGAILLRGRANYHLASNITGIKYNLIYEPERAAFPSVAFKVASWFWTKNAYIIMSNSKPVKGDLNQLADGSFHNFTLLNHAISTSLLSLKERTVYYENAVEAIKDCKAVKKGRGVACELGAKIGYSTPICMTGLKKPYCGCEGEFEVQSCPYGYNSERQCRNPSILKCCVEICNSYLDLVFLIDSSGSVGDKNFPKALNFTKTIIDFMNIGENDTRVAIINFGNNAHIINYLNTTYNKSELFKIVDSIPYLAQMTNTQEALSEANKTILNEEYGMRPVSTGVPKVVVVLTDGQSNVSPLLTIPNAQLIKDRGISIVSVGVGKTLSQKELEGIASNKDDVYNVDDYDGIFQILDELTITACKQPARAVFEEVITAKIVKNSYKYFNLNFEPKNENDTIPNKFTIEVKDIVGRTGLAFSFDDEQPKEDSDYVSDSASSSYYGNYIERFKTAVNLRKQRADEKNNEATSTLYQINRPENKTVLFLGLKGKADENEFHLYIYNKTVTNEIKKPSKVGLVVGIIFGIIGVAVLVAVVIYLAKHRSDNN